DQQGVRAEREGPAGEWPGRYAEPARHSDGLGLAWPGVVRHRGEHDVQQLDERLDGIGDGRSPRPLRRRQLIVERGSFEPELQSGRPGRDGWGRAVLLLCDLSGTTGDSPDVPTLVLSPARP